MKEVIAEHSTVILCSRHCCPDECHNGSAFLQGMTQVMVASAPSQVLLFLGVAYSSKMAVI